MEVSSNYFWKNFIPALGIHDDDGSFYANDNHSKADLLNRFFVKVTGIDDDNVSFPDKFPRTEARLQDIILNPDDVISAIESIPAKKASGPDIIS